MMKWNLNDYLTRGVVFSHSWCHP